MKSLIFGSLFVVVGAGILWVDHASRAQSSAARSWPTTTGTVTRSEVNRGVNISDRNVSYTPIVSYSYTVNGRSYTGDQIDATRGGLRTRIRETAEERVRPYPAGAAVAVHYDPSGPGNAMLETNATSSRLFIVLAALFLAVGMMIIALPRLLAGWWQSAARRSARPSAVHSS